MSLFHPRSRAEQFEAMAAEYERPIYLLCLRMMGNREDAQDCAQEALLRAFRAFDRFRDGASPKTWLYRIAINEALDFVRRQKNVNSATVSTEDEPGVAARLMGDDYFDGDEAQARLQEAVARLPEVQRTVFTLKYFDELKYSEISKILDTSEGALKASYHLAVKKITEYLHLGE